MLLKKRYLMFLIFFVISGLFSLAKADSNPEIRIYYDHSKFVVDNRIDIDLNAPLEEILKNLTYVQHQWISIRYFFIKDYPIRITSAGKFLYEIDFLFINKTNTPLKITLYDLEINSETKIEQLESFFIKHGINYTKGKDNIATYFATFIFSGERLGLCEFRTVILKNYGDYFFYHQGEAPWWLN